MPEIKQNTPGFTLIEMLVVLVVIGILAAIALPQYMSLQNEAEKASVQSVVGSLQSAVSMIFAKSVVNGSIKIEHNPFEALSTAPHNYIGIREITEPDSALSGNWFYDPHNQWVVYCPKQMIEGGYSFGGKTYIVYTVLPVLENLDTVGVWISPPVIYAFNW